MTPPVVILCGGRGTRLQERTQDIPKPLVEIGAKPILWHVIRLYARQGFGRFLLCTGYRHELIERFVEDEAWPEGVEVECVDTGPETPTGGRIHRVGPLVRDGTFCATYADGLADVDLRALLDHHAAHGGLATMTVVRPELPFGIALLGGDGRVAGFREKPRADHWINGGFFVFEPGALEYMDDSAVLERAPLEGLASDGQLQAYRHTGFWECMDTYKDAVVLNDLWAAGEAPWDAADPADPAASRPPGRISAAQGHG
jgi:glucose-1-phosphate cytidylyltransferase